jgi:hypothetical protein
MLYLKQVAFSRNAKIPPVQIGIDTTLYEKRITPATDRVKNKKFAAKRPTGWLSEADDRRIA